MEEASLLNGIKMEQPTIVIQKKNTKSVVWEYFGLECNADGSRRDIDIAVCNMCSSKTSAKGGNTSNLFNHLGVHHPEVYARIRSKKLPSYGSPRGKAKQTEPGVLVSGARNRKRKQAALEAAGAVPGPSTESKPAHRPVQYGRQQRLSEYISVLLAKELVSADVVDSAAFRNLLRAFDPRYELPDSKYFRGSSFPGLYERLRAKIAAEVANMSFFSATIDLIPNASGGSYLTFSVHFIDDGWALKNYCLVTMYVPPGQSIEATADGLVSLLVPWNLPPEKLTCVVTEESGDLVKVLEYMGWPQLPCFGSRIHRSIAAALQASEDATRAIQDCRGLVTRFAQSSERRLTLFKVKGELELADYSLKVDASGHWQATQEMISSVLKLQPALMSVLGEEDPLLESYTHLAAINEALEPVTEIMDILTSECYVNLSSIKPLLHLLKTSVLAPKGGPEHPLTAALKEHIMNGFVSNYEDYRCKVVLNIATHLDPRFKALFSEEGEAESVAELIVSEGVENFPTNPNNTVEVKLETPTIANDPLRKRKSLGKLLEEVKHASAVETPSAAPTNILQKEFEAYLVAPKIDSESNPLSWWKLQASSYPNMALLARKYLSICATKAPSEKLFNQRPDSLFLHGVSKDPEEVNQAMFLARNFSINPSDMLQDI